MDDSLQLLITNVGFPIALSMYLLVRIEGKLNTLSNSIDTLSKNILIFRSNLTIYVSHKIGLFVK